MVTLEYFTKRVKVNEETGCWEWQLSRYHDGYGQAGKKRAHRVMWSLMFGEIPPGMCICHHCDNRICVNPDHLFVGTVADNQRDMAIKGRAVGIKNHTGEKNPKAILTERDVLQIREAYPKRIGTAWAFFVEKAQKYGISPSGIAGVARRYSWKHLTPQGELCSGKS